MDLFTVLEDEHAILFSRGVYKQAKIYRRGERYFAAHGSGFVRLHREHVTSNPNVRWMDISLPTEGKNGVRL